MRPRWRPYASLLTALVLVACGGDGTTPQPEAPETAAPTDAGADSDPGTSDRQPQDEPAADAETSGEQQPGEPPADAETVTEPQRLKRVAVTVYFPSARGDTLVGETREIFNTASPVDRAKQILSDLLAGPVTKRAINVIPRGTRVRQVFVLDSGEAFVDLTSEVKAGMPGGTHAEMMVVYSIVNSVAMNVPEVRRVGLLMEGQPLDTLNGHLDLRRPLPPKVSLLEGYTGRGKAALRPADDVAERAG